MSDWITIRKPTSTDGNSNEDVWVCYSNGEVFSAKWWSAAAQDHCVAWKCKERTPEPYVPTPPSEPEKPRRKRWKHINGNFKSLVESLQDFLIWRSEIDEEIRQNKRNRMM